MTDNESIVDVSAKSTKVKSASSEQISRRAKELGKLVEKGLSGIDPKQIQWHLDNAMAEIGDNLSSFEKDYDAELSRFEKLLSTRKGKVTKAIGAGLNKVDFGQGNEHLYLNVDEAMVYNAFFSKVLKIVKTSKTGGHSVVLDEINAHIKEMLGADTLSDDDKATINKLISEIQQLRAQKTEVKVVEIGAPPKQEVTVNVTQEVKSLTPEEAAALVKEKSTAGVPPTSSSDSLKAGVIAKLEADVARLQKEMQAADARATELFDALDEQKEGVTQDSADAAEEEFQKKKTLWIQAQEKLEKEQLAQKRAKLSGNKQELTAEEMIAFRKKQSESTEELPPAKPKYTKSGKAPKPTGTVTHKGKQPPTESEADYVQSARERIRVLDDAYDQFLSMQSMWMSGIEQAVGDLLESVRTASEEMVLVITAEVQRSIGQKLKVIGRQIEDSFGPNATSGITGIGVKLDAINTTLTEIKNGLVRKKYLEESVIHRPTDPDINIQHLAEMLGDATVDKLTGQPFFNPPEKYLQFSKGGVVPGTGSSDSVRALLTPGEIVFNPRKLAGGTGFDFSFENDEALKEPTLLKKYYRDLLHVDTIGQGNPAKGLLSELLKETSQKILAYDDMMDIYGGIAYYNRPSAAESVLPVKSSVFGSGWNTYVGELATLVQGKGLGATLMGLSLAKSLASPVGSALTHLELKAIPNAKTIKSYLKMGFVPVDAQKGGGFGFIPMAANIGTFLSSPKLSSEVRDALPKGDFSGRRLPALDMFSHLTHFPYTTWNLDTMTPAQIEAGTLIGNIPSKLASGGPLMPGQTAVVGEDGPEMLVPAGRGFHVIPNPLFKAMGGARFLAGGTRWEGGMGGPWAARLLNELRYFITGVLVATHVIRLLTASSKVYQKSMDMVNRGWGYMLDMILLPALPVMRGLMLLFIGIGKAINGVNRFFRFPFASIAIMFGVVAVAGYLMIQSIRKAKASFDQISASFNSYMQQNPTPTPQQYGSTPIGPPPPPGPPTLLQRTGARVRAAGSAVRARLGFALGGKIPGYGGGDTVPILAERGELIVPKEIVRGFEHRADGGLSGGVGNFGDWFMGAASGFAGMAAGGISGLLTNPAIQGIFTGLRVISATLGAVMAPIAMVGGGIAAAMAASNKGMGVLARIIGKSGEAQMEVAGNVGRAQRNLLTLINIELLAVVGGVLAILNSILKGLPVNSQVPEPPKPPETPKPPEPPNVEPPKPPESIKLPSPPEPPKLPAGSSAALTPGRGFPQIPEPPKPQLTAGEGGIPKLPAGKGIVEFLLESGNAIKAGAENLLKGGDEAVKKIGEGIKGAGEEAIRDTGEVISKTGERVGDFTFEVGEKTGGVFSGIKNTAKNAIAAVTGGKGGGTYNPAGIIPKIGEFLSTKAGGMLTMGALSFVPGTAEFIRTGDAVKATATTTEAAAGMGALAIGSAALSQKFPIAGPILTKALAIPLAMTAHNRMVADSALIGEEVAKKIGVDKKIGGITGGIVGGTANDILGGIIAMPGNPLLGAILGLGSGVVPDVAHLVDETTRRKAADERPYATEYYGPMGVPLTAIYNSLGQIEQSAPAITNAITGAPSAVGTAVTGGIDTASQAISTALTSAGELLTTAVDTVKGVVDGVLNTVKEWQDAAATAGAGVRETILGAFESLGEYLAGLPSAIMKMIDGYMSGLPVIGALWNSAKGAINFPSMASGGDILSDGFVKVHSGESIIPARVNTNSSTRTDTTKAMITNYNTFEIKRDDDFLLFQRFQQFMANEQRRYTL